MTKEDSKEAISHHFVGNSIWHERHMDNSVMKHKNREKKGIQATKQESREAISLASEEGDARVRNTQNGLAKFLWAIYYGCVTL